MTYKDFTIEEHIRAQFRIHPSVHVKATNIFADTYTITERDVKNQTIKSWKVIVTDTGEKYEFKKLEETVTV